MKEIYSLTIKSFFGYPNKERFYSSQEKAQEAETKIKEKIRIATIWEQAKDKFYDNYVTTHPYPTEQSSEILGLAIAMNKWLEERTNALLEFEQELHGNLSEKEINEIKWLLDAEIVIKTHKLDQ